MRSHRSSMLIGVMKKRVITCAENSCRSFCSLRTEFEYFGSLKIDYDKEGSQL